MAVSSIDCMLSCGGDSSLLHLILLSLQSSEVDSIILTLQLRQLRLRIGSLLALGCTARKVLGTEFEIRALADSNAWAKPSPIPQGWAGKGSWRKGAGALVFLKTLPASWIETNKSDQSNSCVLFHQQKDLLNYHPRFQKGGQGCRLMRGGPKALPWLLILDFSGQTLEEATSISLAGTTTVNIHAVTQTPGEERGTGLVSSCHCK